MPPTQSETGFWAEKRSETRSATFVLCKTRSEWWNLAITVKFSIVITSWTQSAKVDPHKHLKIAKTDFYRKDVIPDNWPTATMRWMLQQCISQNRHYNSTPQSNKFTGDSAITYDTCGICADSVKFTAEWSKPSSGCRFKLFYSTFREIKQSFHLFRPQTGA